MTTSVLRFGLTSFYPLNRLKFRAESNYDTAHARRRKEMVDIFVRCCSKSLTSILRVILWSVEVDISDSDRY